MSSGPWLQPQGLHLFTVALMKSVLGDHPSGVDITTLETHVFLWGLISLL